ncbi:NCS1 family nucleobase:cation symporter-1 [Pseudomonas solani]|uniref:NCS1 family nucleobase:cation symporter-1 n=1 Tax=Pseudomonas solani TaxID=2731552 RepID=UPI0035BE4A43
MPLSQNQEPIRLPLDPSPSLYNDDLAPNSPEARHWGSYSLFALWTNDVHNVANYSFAIGLFALGMSGGQIVAAMGLGALLIYGLMNLSGYIGQRTGLPFPVICRIAFGIRGAQFPALIRAVIAVAWFGIQTYLASLVLGVLLLTLAPGLAAWSGGDVLGLSPFGWACFIGVWLLQLAIMAYGMEMIRRYEAFAGPVILLTLAVLAAWMYWKAGLRIAWASSEPASGAAGWFRVCSGAALWISLYGTMLLNFSDFSRHCPDARTIRRGNFWGLPVNMLLFGCIAAVLAGSQFAIDGQVITSPTDIVAAIPSKPFLVLGCLALLIVTVAVNIMANFVAPALVLCNLAPRQLNFHRAGLLAAALGALILPWHLYNSPEVILYFLGALGALLGPLYGVIMVDYWLVRRGRLDIPALYSAAPDAAYHYRHGVNPRALAALLPAAIIAIALVLLPSLEALSSFSWFIGAGLAAVFYLLVGNRRYRFDVWKEAFKRH